MMDDPMSWNMYQHRSIKLITCIDNNEKLDLFSQSKEQKVINGDASSEHFSYSQSFVEYFGPCCFFVPENVPKQQNH